MNDKKPDVESSVGGVEKPLKNPKPTKQEKKAKKEVKKEASKLQRALSAVGKTEKDIFVDRGIPAIRNVGNYVSIVTVEGQHLYLDLENCCEVDRRSVYPRR